MPRTPLVLTLLSFVLCLLALLARPGIAATVVLDERIEMPDGIGLAARIVLPNESEDAWPVILVRTPYTNFGEQAYLVEDGLDLVASLGYVTVIQHTRGFGDSEGERDPFRHDAEDGRATLDWVLAQPWCDGRVMVPGASALGIPAYLMAPGADPGMICQLVAIASPDVYQVAFEGGVFKGSDAVAWSRWIGASHIIEELAGHEICDDFWDPLRATAGASSVRAATLHVGGWFDLFAEGTLAGFDMYRQSDDAWTAEHQYLLMGPWDHHHFGEATTGELTFPTNARMDYVAEILKWIGWCFETSPGAVNRWAKVRYYTMGDVEDPEAPGNEWRSADTWPPFDTVPLWLYVEEDGVLSWEPPPVHGWEDIPYDSADPSPTEGGRNLHGAPGPREQSRVESRDDALVLTSDVLGEPVEATGRVTARIHVTTDGLDADVAVRLTDVYPDGRSFLILDSIQRLSRREGCAQVVPVRTGDLMEVEVDLGTTSYVFNRGHRIRMVVTGSNAPRFAANPAGRVDGGPGPITLRILYGPGRRSALILPTPPPEPLVVEGAEVVEAAEVADEAPVVEPVLEAVDVVEAPDANLEIVVPDAVSDLPVFLDAGTDTPPEVGGPDSLRRDMAREDSAGPRDVPLADIGTEPSPSPQGGGGCHAGRGDRPHAAPLFLLAALLIGVTVTRCRRDPSRAVGRGAVRRS